MSEQELKPCPFCGQQDAFVEQLDSDASVVICQGMVDEHSACLARGPVGMQQSDMEDQPGRDAAIAEWNRRAHPDAALVEAAEAALKAIQDTLEDAYHNAFPECCGQSHLECCGSPIQAWDERDQKIMDRLAPHEQALRAALAGKGSSQ